MRPDAFELFEEIVAAPADERPALVDRLCPQGDERREQVLLLLRFDRPASTAGVAAVAVDAGREPAAVPGFRVGSVIGTGATSVVYRATQLVPPREVALKVLVGAQATPAARRRFRTEVESLARLTHLGIAQVFAAGELEEGPVPGAFLAMELVEGLPIDAFAEVHGLDVPARVRLLIQVAEAVQHAHGRGVLHRDLKPGNILVADGPDRPRPKVLDFGIARILDPAGAGTLTDGGFVGTMCYAAPESFGGMATTAVDVRSDVYALGVIAYELLGGALPLDVRREPLGRAIDRIRSEEPWLLGRRDRSLRGDLERIVAMALRKDPSERYQTVQALADDLGRYLEHRPVQARTAGMLHRMGLLFRRQRRTAVFATVAIVVAVGAGVWARLREGEHARGSVHVADAVLANALQALERIPGTLDSRRRTLDALFQQMRPALDRLPADPPALAVLGRLVRQRGDVLRDQGDWREAQTMREQGLRVYERLAKSTGSPADRRELAIEMVLLGDCTLEQGRPLLARQWWERAHTLFGELAERTPLDRRAVDDLGCSLDRLARLDLDAGGAGRLATLLAERAVVNTRLLELAPDDRHTLLGLCDFHHLSARHHGGLGDAGTAATHWAAAMAAVRRLWTMDPRDRVHRRRYLETLGDLAAAGVPGLPPEAVLEAERSNLDWRTIEPDDGLETQAVLRLWLVVADAALGRGDAPAARQALLHAVDLFARCTLAGRRFWAPEMLRLTLAAAERTGPAPAPPPAAVTVASLWLRDLIEGELPNEHLVTALTAITSADLLGALPAELAEAAVLRASSAATRATQTGR